MSDRTMELLDYINSSDMERFEKSSPKQKAQLIFRSFQSYRANQSKVAKAKTDEEKDAFAVHVERFWLLANKQIKSLNDSEMTVYLRSISDRLSKALESRDDNKVLDNKLLFGTILRQLPEGMSEEHLGIKTRLEEMLEGLDFTFEK